MILSKLLSLHFLFFFREVKMGRVHLLCIAMTLASVGAYNKYEGGQYLSIFLRTFSFIQTYTFRCNGKIQKVARETRWKSPNQVICLFSFLLKVKISRRDSRGVDYVDNWVTSKKQSIFFGNIP